MQRVLKISNGKVGLGEVIQISRPAAAKNRRIAERRQETHSPIL